MKHMFGLLVISEPPASVISKEGIDETLSMEGFAEALKKPFVALKKAFTLTSEEAFMKDLKLRRKILEQEKKNLEMTRSGLMKIKDTDNYTVNLKRVLKRVNFSASTPEQVIAGFQKNKKFIDGLITELGRVTQKAEAEKIKDKLDAEMNKRGSLKEEMIFNKSQVIKLFDECISLTNTLLAFLDTLEKVATNHLSTEGLGSFIANFFVGVLTVIIQTFIVVVAGFGIYFLLTFIAAQPLLGLIVGGIVLIGYGVSTSSKEEQAEHLLSGH